MRCLSVHIAEPASAPRCGLSGKLGDWMTDTNKSGFLGSLRFRYGLALSVFLAAAGFLLWEEHEVHILGYLPVVLILGACIGVHFLLHSGHGGHDDNNRRGAPTPNGRE